MATTTRRGINEYRILLEKGEKLGSTMNTFDREDELAQIHGIMKDIMKGH